MSEIRLCILGDISLTDSLYQDYKKNKNLIQKEIIDYINDSDVITGNFEFAIISKKKRVHLFSRDRFYSKTEHLDIIKDIDWTFFTIANNHISDWGYDNIILTKNILKNISKYEPIGAGFNELDALNPLIIEKNGIRIGFLAISEKEINNAKKNRFGSAPFNEDLLKNILSDLKNKTDYIISIIHWGTEFIPYPSPEQKVIAKFLSENGVNLIVGSHPHILQGYEKFYNTDVFYSLGNFIADLSLDNKPEERFYNLGHYSFIFKIIIDELNNINFEKKFIQIDKDNHIVSFVNDEQLEKLNKLFSLISERTKDYKKYYYSNLFDIIGKREYKAIIKEHENFITKLRKILFYIRLKYIKKFFLYLYYKYLTNSKEKFDIE